MMICFLGVSIKARNLSNFGIEQVEFQEYSHHVMKSLNDLLMHLDDKSTSYKNDLGRVYKSDENNSVVINNFDDAQFIYFLGYISAIDLKMGNRFDIRNTPDVDALRNLYYFYAQTENVDLFPYWIIYNLFALTETKITGNPLWLELLDSNDIDEALIEYSRSNNDLFAKDIQLNIYTNKMYEELYGILVFK